MTQAPLNQAIVAALVQAVQSAGEAIMPFFGPNRGELAVQSKDDLTPVTAGDWAAHRALIAKLQHLTPGWTVVSEEDPGPREQLLSPGPYWLIDPLDGTREFVSGSGEFTVNLALICDQVSVWGCVHAPALGQTYWGGLGSGAFRCVAGITQGIAVRTEPVDANEYRVIASKSHLDAQTAQFIARLGTCQCVQAGSSLKFCRIAEGQADLYPRFAPTCEWDTAAAQAVLEAAGGFVHDLKGQPLRYGKPSTLNPFFVAGRPGVAWST